MARHLKTGEQGEDVAVRFLAREGYTIVDRNVQCRRGEIDIVARENGTLVFVEVKTRSGNAFGTPEDAVTPTKLQRIARAAEEYLQRCHLAAENSRFDVVAVMIAANEIQDVRLIRNAAALGEYL